jgi:hypothetical protein
MKPPQVIVEQEVVDVLGTAVTDGVTGVMTYQATGKWHIAEVLLRKVTDTTLQLDTKPQQPAQSQHIQVNQPVGMSFQREYDKYIFETVVVGFEPSVNDRSIGRVVLELPDRIERMQRRAYTRVDVPEQLHVNVLFWHRGYMDSVGAPPIEDYWQGRLVNLSAGGLQIGIDTDQGANFRTDQLVGLQFTPMSYEKPILVEARVKHLAEHAQDNQLYVGVEFLGLELSSEGREKIRRLVDVVESYEKQNVLAESGGQLTTF